MRAVHGVVCQNVLIALVGSLVKNVETETETKLVMNANIKVIVRVGSVGSHIVRIVTMVKKMVSSTVKNANHLIALSAKLTE